MIPVNHALSDSPKALKTNHISQPMPIGYIKTHALYLNQMMNLGVSPDNVSVKYLQTQD
jgi:hypothetical protein